MNLLVAISVFTVGVLYTFTAAEKKCYISWEPFVADMERRCKMCAQDDEVATAKCYQKAWYPFKPEGNLDTREYLSIMFDEGNYTGSAETKPLVKASLAACLDPEAKTREQLHNMDECMYKAYTTHCEESVEWIEKIGTSETLKKCI